MDTLQAMKVFVRVAQRSGFAAAARDLRMSPAAVTKQVAALEERVGARLFDRTTRSVGLTEAGRLYLERCLECLQTFEDADASLAELGKKPQGLLRITAPTDLQAHLPPLVARFLAAHPQVTVDLRLSNRSVDLVEEGVDLALRVAVSLEGHYVARPVALVRVLVVASPAYLREHGHPRRPEELERHPSAVFAEPRPRDEWTFERDGERVKVKLNPVVTTNSGEVLRGSMIAGAGLSPLPSFLLGDDLEAGRLQATLVDWKVLPDLRVFALYPHRRFLSPKVGAFVELLRAAWGDGTTDPFVATPPRAAGRPSRSRRSVG